MAKEKLESPLKSPLLEKVEDTIEKPDYSSQEEEYLKGLRKKMELARDNRDTAHIEFDGMSYLEYYNLNERLANTYVEPKKNKEDSNFQSGTIRVKLFALLSSVANLDLSGDISAYAKSGFKIQSLGDALEDVVLKTNELDTDDEKKVLRQYELLKQGTVFVEEIWDAPNKKEKKMKGKFTGKLDVEWTTKIKKAFARPSRNIIPGINVYLGDITKYDSREQPYIFTVDHKPYEEAKLIFGGWDRWDNVPKKITEEILSWQLLPTQEDFVEIIRYQNKNDNEFAVLINGVLMTPVALPLPWGYEDYNIAQQNLEPIHSKFAYGKSLVFRIRNKVAIYDEMLRLGVGKTQMSFKPTLLNNSGRILSGKVFAAGKVIHGIPQGAVSLAFPEGSHGVTTSELAMIQELKESIDSETTSPTFQGQREGGNPTATEIIELQRQAKQMLGLVIFSVSLLEWKLEWLRLLNLLKNWFNPQDSVVDEARGVLRSTYRQVGVNRPIEGEGMGMRMVIPTDSVPTDPRAIMQAEDIVSKEQGMPVRFIFLNPEEVKSSKLQWQIVVRPRERRTSETDKLLFRAFMADAMPLVPNMQELQQEFSAVWAKNPQKLFAPNPLPSAPEEMGKGAGSPVSPRTSLPSPEMAMGRRVRQTLGVGV